MNKKPMVILTGPTAVGKTGLSIELAKAINAEIISADSMQVYKGMNIGSAKIMENEMHGVRHHLIDILDPHEAFNVVSFQNYAKAAINEIYQRGRIPLIVGGTGFYIQSILYDIEFTEHEESSIRKELEEYALEHGSEALHALLKEVDPVSAEIIPFQNMKRVIRAIEFYRENSKPISEHNNEQRQKESAYNFVYFVLNDERSRLYSRINERVDKMMDDGLAGEVLELKKQGLDRSFVSMQGLGYKELLDYYDGLYSYEEAVEKIKQDTRHFAKRQLTWFRREKEVIFIDKDKFNYDSKAMILEMIRIIKDKKIKKESVTI